MRSQDFEKELIYSIDITDFGKLKDFLKTLEVTEENKEKVSSLVNEKDPGELFTLETISGEKFVIVISKHKIHISLKKNDKFDSLKEKFLKFFED